MSVACQFIRFNASKTIVKNSSSSEDRIISISNEDLNTIKEIDNINTKEEFNGKHEALERTFEAKLIGTSSDQKLRISVLKMNKKINANNAKKGKNERIDQLVLQDRNYDEAKEEAIKCFNTILGGVSEYQSKINLLIRICDGDIESSVKSSKWECPISIDNEIDPMILVTINQFEITPVFVSFDKNTTERIVNCPLNVLYILEFMEKLKSFIDHSISLKNYRSSLETSNPIQKSPFTSKNIIGSIPSGENKEHINAAYWTLMKIITGATWICLTSPILIPRIPMKLNLFYIRSGHFRQLLEIVDMFHLELPSKFYSFATRVEIFTRLLTFFKRNPRLLDMYLESIKNAMVFINVDSESSLKAGGLCGDLFIPGWRN
ncbi:hypothetical protein LY90DRAFT_622982 [Neocallimastix californiae]|uniref:Uncharacterized protein n=1 Tax=Neocallimastix californiae TaxID=1754190 RepID=A0A1Y2F9J7_9FUNG|nr:hypothetical protein LY90DRAFT_622982 [Neocallimastix californiae]|eukprot:ORY80114.1 hypothetical protein LY90DRAFT_622982 [Neocallimastix californiae]